MASATMEPAILSGAKNVVAANITSKETRAVYTHCYGHAVNLTVGDTVKRSKVMCNFLDTVFAMSKLIKYPPRRDTILEQLMREMAPDTPRDGLQELPVCIVF